MTLTKLAPKATLAELHPPGTALALRSSLERTRWVLGQPQAHRLDALTGFVVAVLGPMPLICHRGAATDEALQLMRLAGLDTPANLQKYESEAEAIALAQALAAEGWPLAYIYPPPPGADDPAQLLVPLDLYGALNDKANLADFVAAEHLAPRQVVPIEAARNETLRPPNRPVFVKVSHAGASGFGVGVRYCASPEDWHIALDEFAASDSVVLRLVVEEAIDIRICWCLSMGITADDVRYLGAAIQLFGKPGQQIGSLVDPAQSPPDAVVRIVFDVGEKARRRGYRGIAGVDIGQDAEGRLYVFDLNFRLNGSTPQVLLHDAATARLGARVSRSFDVTVAGRLGSALDRIAPYVEQGRFVPIRLYDARDATWGKTKVTGLVIDDSPEAAERFASELADVLADCSGEVRISSP